MSWGRSLISRPFAIQGSQKDPFDLENRFNVQKLGKKTGRHLESKFLIPQTLVNGRSRAIGVAKASGSRLKTRLQVLSFPTPKCTMTPGTDLESCLALLQLEQGKSWQSQLDQL